MNKKFIIILIIIMVSSFILAGITFQATGGFGDKKEIVINEEKTLSTTDVNSIYIETISSDIDFILVDGDEITAKYYGKITCYYCETNYSLEATKDSNNNISFETKSKSKSFILFFTNVKLDIYLPRDYAEKLSIKTVSGDVEVSEVNLSQLNVTTVSGDLNFSNITLQNSTLRSVSGDVTGNDISGDIEFNTTSGNIYLKNFDGSLDGNSVSGDFDIDENRNTFSINIRTNSGDIDLDLNENASFEIYFNSTSGDIEHDFSVTVPQGANNTDHHFEGLVGSGGNKINIYTVSGDLDMK